MDQVRRTNGLPRFRSGACIRRGSGNRVEIRTVKCRTSIGSLSILLGACSINPSGATVLDLDEGDVVETYEFQAMDPSQWVFAVNVTALRHTLMVAAEHV